jgi:hypothetical protein
VKRHLWFRVIEGIMAGGISMRRIGLLCLIVLVTIAMSAPRPAPGFTDPHARFTIDGLRLGMSSPEVLRSLMEHVGSHFTEEKTPCVRDYIMAVNKRMAPALAEKNCTDEFAFEEPGADLHLWFTENFPTHPGESVLTTLAVNEMSDDLSERLQRQFGPPTIHDHERPWVVGIWCTTACGTWDTTHLFSPESGTTLLLHRGNGLTLVDPAYEQVREDAIQETLKSHHIIFEQGYPILSHSTQNAFVGSWETSMRTDGVAFTPDGHAFFFNAQHEFPTFWATYTVHDHTLVATELRHHLALRRLDLAADGLLHDRSTMKLYHRVKNVEFHRARGAPVRC